MDLRKYTILGACHTPPAHRALQADPEIGLLLPRIVIVYEESGGSAISIIDPISMLGMLENPALDPEC